MLPASPRARRLTSATRTPPQEAYLCHDFAGRDFYGAEMKLMICAFLRPQLKFDSFDELIQAITDDVTFGREALDSSALATMREDTFFHAPALAS